MQAIGRLAVTGGEHCHTDLAAVDRLVDVVKQPVPRLHALAVEKALDIQKGEVLVEQPGEGLLRVNAPVVYKHIAWPINRHESGSADRSIVPIAEEVAACALDHGRVRESLHGSISEELLLGDSRFFLSGGVRMKEQEG